jgi:hypothetical protein
MISVKRLRYSVCTTLQLAELLSSSTSTQSASSWSSVGVSVDVRFVLRPLLVLVRLELGPAVRFVLGPDGLLLSGSALTAFAFVLLSPTMTVMVACYCST